MNWNAECEPDPIAWPHWYSCVNGSISPHPCSNIYCTAFPWSLLGRCLYTIGHVQSCCICDFMLLCAVCRNQKVILHLTEVSKCHCIPTNIIMVSSLPMPCVCVLPELSVHVQGQMGTFMSVWVWITLPATSGSPHGTADYGRRERKAGGQAGGRALPPPLQGYLYDSRVLQQGTGTNAKWKGHMSPLQPQDHCKALCHLYRVNLTVFE